jgi:hypothetical protein
MAARDSDDDIRKYLPELSTILREADPARAKEKLTKAQDNPELDAAIAHAQRPSARPSEASPWAAEPVGIAPAALPSSLAAPPVVKEPEARRGSRAGFPGWAKAIVAVIAAVGPVALLWVLLVRPDGRDHVDPARVVASAASSAPAAPTTSASASPIVPVPAPVPTMAPDADAGATVAPTVQSGGSSTKPKSHPGTRDDPYDAAPPPPAKTVDAVVAPPPLVVPPAPIAPVVSSAPAAPPPSATATVKPIF